MESDTGELRQADHQPEAVVVWVRRPFAAHTFVRMLCPQLMKCVEGLGGVATLEELLEARPTTCLCQWPSVRMQSSKLLPHTMPVCLSP